MRLCMHVCMHALMLPNAYGGGTHPILAVRHTWAALHRYGGWCTGRRNTPWRLDPLASWLRCRGTIIILLLYHTSSRIDGAIRTRLVSLHASRSVRLHRPAKHSLPFSRPKRRLQRAPDQIGSDGRTRLRGRVARGLLAAPSAWGAAFRAKRAFTCTLGGRMRGTPCPS